MKKKVICGLLILGLVLSVIKVDNANASVENLEEVEFSLLDVIESENINFIDASTSADEWVSDDGECYTYPITTNSEKWEEYETHDEMVAACTIPDEVLVEMSTEELLSIVMDYPLLCDIYAYNSYQEGLCALAVNFNGLRELLSREDGADTLLSYYSDYEIASEPETSQVILNKISEANDKELTKILNDKDSLDNIQEDFKELGNIELTEMLLMSDVVLDSLDEEQQDEISELACEKYEEKQKSDLYNGKEDSIYQIADENGVSYVLNDLREITDDSELAFGSSSTAIVRTPKGSQVSVVVFEHLGDAWVAVTTARAKKAYPNATILADADNRYNCHSYAWYKQSTSNKYWMNKPHKYMTDGSYTSVGSKPNAVGQKVIWHSYSGPEHIIEHSGIVTSISGSTYYIKSKWGQLPLMKHNATYSPYTNVRKYYKLA